jgi:Ca2+-binding RTX toxin-like protein
MTSFIITGSNTTAQTLGGSELGVITSSGALSPEGTAVTITSYALLTVNGAITTMGTGVSLVLGGQVVVGSGGTINTNGTAVRQVDPTSINIFLLNNAGAISGSIGVEFSGRGAAVVNSGSIQGYLGSAVILSGTDEAFATRLINSGLISGRAHGVSSNGTVTERITNAEDGVITGLQAALSLSNAVSLVINRGVLDGNVSLAGGADRFDGSLGLQGAVFGGTDDDTILGGAGNDSLLGEAGADRLRGAAGDDSMVGGTEDDILGGAAGEDVLQGDDGADKVYGGAADDDLSGGAGNDLLLGGLEDDILRGGGDLDTLYGGGGDDTLTGGVGADTFVFSVNQGTDRITDFANNVDKIDLRAFDFDNFTQLRALSSASALGVRIDLPGEGMLYLGVLSLANFDASDVLI